MTSLFVATPAYGSTVCTNYFLSMINLDRLCRKNNIDIDYFTYDFAIISVARNELTKQFIDSKYTHMLFMDSDQSFEAEDIIMMINADLPVIGGKIPRKVIHWDKIMKHINNAAYSREIDINTIKKIGTEYNYVPLDTPATTPILTPAPTDTIFEEVKVIGTGAMLIQRGVFKKLLDIPTENNPMLTSYKNGEKTIYTFFETGKIDNDYVSEDYYFCKMWRNIGEKVYMMVNFRAKHYGVYAYE
jgi:hypothetical protein